MPNQKLIPCPFCKSEPKIGLHSLSLLGYMVYCPNCDGIYRTGGGMCGGEESKKNAIEAWNKELGNIFNFQLIDRRSNG